MAILLVAMRPERVTQKVEALLVRLLDVARTPISSLHKNRPDRDSIDRTKTHGLYSNHFNFSIVADSVNLSLLSGSATKRLHFFISRAGEDREWAKWIAQTLEAVGYTTTVQDFDFRPGHNFFHQMNEAATRADHFIVLLSSHYFAKSFTLKELFAGVANDPIGRDRFVIPVRIQKCEIPRMFSDLIYIDLVDKQEDEARELLLKGIQPHVDRSVAIFPGAPGGTAGQRTTYQTRINNLPSVDSALYGRAEELRLLNEAWASTDVNLLQVVASGGTGKTALIDRWFRKHLHEATVFAWSFYTQGTKNDQQTSSDPFFVDAMTFFDISVPNTASIYTKAELLARKLRNNRVLLLLDGIEPLQEIDGRLRDAGLKALLQELATRNVGMVLCTSRIFLSEIPDDPPRTQSIRLENLGVDSGVQYLRHLGVKGLDSELADASREYGNHALALTLLGSYLVDFYNGDVGCRRDIPALMIDDVRSGRHARRIMQAYAQMLEGTPESQILQNLGFFDRPAEPDAFRFLLPEISETRYRGALSRLKQARLVLPEYSSEGHQKQDGLIDCHPLIREYFSGMMREKKPDAFRAGHEHLYRFFQSQASEAKPTRDELTRLCCAVYHGCQAELHQEVFDDIYLARISGAASAYRSLG